MCINNTGIGSISEATYIGLRYLRLNSWNGTANERVKQSMLDLLYDKPYMHSDSPRPAVEDPDDDSDDEDNDPAPPSIDNESEDENNEPPPLMEDDDSDDETNDDSIPDEQLGAQ